MPTCILHVVARSGFILKLPSHLLQCCAGVWGLLIMLSCATDSGWNECRPHELSLLKTQAPNSSQLNQCKSAAYF